MLIPDSYAWDDNDLLLSGEEAAQLVAARRAAIRFKARQAQKTLAAYTSDTVFDLEPHDR